MPQEHWAMAKISFNRRARTVIKRLVSKERKRDIQRTSALFNKGK